MPPIPTVNDSTQRTPLVNTQHSGSPNPFRQDITSVPLVPVAASRPVPQPPMLIKPRDIKVLELEELTRLDSAAHLQMFFETVEQCTNYDNARLEVAKLRVDGNLAVIIHTAQQEREIRVWEHLKTS